MFYAFSLKKIKKIFFGIVTILTLCIVAYIAVSWYYPLKYIQIIEENCRKYNLSPSLVCAVIHTESKFDKDALSQKGASGLMQIVEGTADWAAEEIGLSNYSYNNIFRPEVNIEIGCWMLDRLINQFGDLDKALAAYNAGSGNVSKWLKNEKYSKDGKNLDEIPFAETKNYIKRVRFNAKIYDYILKFYGGTYENKQ